MELVVSAVVPLPIALYLAGFVAGTLQLKT
jgi:hypothetical protein